MMHHDHPFHDEAVRGHRLFRRRRILESALLASERILPILVMALGAGMLLRYRHLGGWLVPALTLAALVWGGIKAWRFGRRHHLDVPEFLRHLESRTGIGDNRLVNAHELEERAGAMTDDLSRGLALLAVEKGRQDFAALPIRRLSPAIDVRRPVAIAGVSAALAIALFWVSPGAFLSSASRLVKPGTRDLPPSLAMRIEPGNATVDRGSSVRIIARLSGAPEQEPQLLVRAPGAAWKRLPMPAGMSATEFTANLEAVLEQTEYAVATGDTRSDTYRIQVVEPLRAVLYQKRIEFPGYTGLDPIEESANDGNLVALRGSRIRFAVQPSRGGVSGRLVFDDGGELAMQEAADGGVGTTISVVESREFRVELEAGGAAPGRWRSEAFQLEAVADRMPTLFQAAPERSIQLPPDMQVPLEVDCLDDFGLTRLDLVYRRNDGEAVRRNLSRWTDTREARVSELWNLDGIAQVPGDRISYHLELTDNDAVSGPKTTVGPECEIRYPSLDEMYAEVKEDRADQTGGLREALQSQKELKEELRRMQSDFRQSKALKWEQQEQLRDVAERQQAISEQIQQLSQSLDQSLDRMEQTSLFSPEILEKVQQINHLVREMQSPMLQEYLQKLQEAMERLDRQAVEKALENLQLTQQELERNLDRTLEMLQQLQREENLERLLAQAEKLLQEQKNLNEQLEEKPDGSQQNHSEQRESASEAEEKPSDKSKQGEQEEKPSGDERSRDANQADPSSSQKPSDQAQAAEEKPGEQMSAEEAEALRQQQEELRRKLEEMRREFEKLQAEAQEKWEELKRQMEEQQAEQQLNQASQKMQQASQSMQSGAPKKKSARFGREAEQDLEQFAKGMRQAQAQMNGAEIDEAVRELFRISGNLVSVSRDQEEMLRVAPERSTRDLSLEQMRLQEGARRNLDQLFDLGRKNRFITSELGRLMGSAVTSLDQARRAFERGTRHEGMALGRNSSQALDATVLALLDAGKEMQNSSCAGACANPLSKLRSLCGQQQSLNESAAQMMGQMPGGSRLGSGPGSSEQLAEMAARQEMIRRGLGEVQQMLGNQGNVLGRLGDLGEEMDEVVQEMRRRGVDERILKRQERILSRLLTAQRSLRKEGEKQERISRTGVNPLERPSPADVVTGPSWQEALRRGVLRGLQDPVPSEYRRLVDTYFRNLKAEP